MYVNSSLRGKAWAIFLFNMSGRRQTKSYSVKTKTKPHGSRKFYDIPTSHESTTYASKTPKCDTEAEQLFDYINKNIIGKDTVFEGSFGKRQGKMELSRVIQLTVTEVYKS